MSNQFQIGDAPEGLLTVSWEGIERGKCLKITVGDRTVRLDFAQAQELTTLLRNEFGKSDATLVSEALIAVLECWQRAHPFPLTITPVRSFPKLEDRCH